MTATTTTAAKPLPFKEDEIVSLASKFKTPFHLYDESTIRLTCRQLKDSFSWLPHNRFRNFFAVKATPNPHILSIMKDEGFGVDCSSLAELQLAEACNFRGEEIMFTSNNTPLCELTKAESLKAIVNLDDASHVAFVEEKLGLPDLICFRFNPGAARSGNFIIGEPAEAKFGLTKEQLFDAFSHCKSKGVTRFGLHTMIVSNCLDVEELAKTAKMMFELVVELRDRVGITLEFVNLGGGIGIPYRPDQTAIDIKALGESVRLLYDKILRENGFSDIGVFYECGRFITGPAGCLVTRVRHQKNCHKKYIGVDACMANLMRPGMYTAYHHIGVVNDDSYEGKELPSKRNLFEDETNNCFDVVGSLCENNDKFAIDRHFDKTPKIGDLLVIHDTGAHGHAMGFNYNGKLRSAEYLRKTDGAVKEIRSEQTMDSYFDTLKWRGLPGQTFKDCVCNRHFALGALFGLLVGVGATRKVFK